MLNYKYSVPVYLFYVHYAQKVHRNNQTEKDTTQEEPRQDEDKLVHKIVGGY